MKIILILCLLFPLIVLPSCKNKQDDSLDAEISKSYENFLNREIYTSFDNATLQKIPDEMLEQAIIDYILEKIAKDFSKEEKVISKLSVGMQAVYTTWVVEAEVNNGGFHQYYWNTSGKLALRAMEGFKQIGALETAQLMANSVAVAVYEIPEIKKNIQKKQLEIISKKLFKYTKLNDLDLIFFKNNENIPKLRIKYIRSNLPLFNTN